MKKMIIMIDKLIHFQKTIVISIPGQDDTERKVGLVCLCNFRESVVHHLFHQEFGKTSLLSFYFDSLLNYLYWDSVIGGGMGESFDGCQGGWGGTLLKPLTHVASK